MMRKTSVSISRRGLIVACAVAAGLASGCAAPDPSRDLNKKVASLRSEAEAEARQNMQAQGFDRVVGARFRFYQNPKLDQPIETDEDERGFVNPTASAKVAWQFRVDHVDPMSSCKINEGEGFYPLMIQLEFDFKGGYLTLSDPPQAINWRIDCLNPSKNQIAAMLGEERWMQDEGRPLRWASVTMSKEASVKLSYRWRLADGSIGPWIPATAAFASAQREHKLWSKAIWSQAQAWPQAKAKLMEMER